jgi:hypothetical protein
VVIEEVYIFSVFRLYTTRVGIGPVGLGLRFSLLTANYIYIYIDMKLPRFGLFDFFFLLISG